VVERDPALPDGDGTLKEQLAAEAEGILAWLVQGVLLYQREGLDPPAEVVAFTKKYIAEQDHLGRWLANFERCAPAQGTRASELFADFYQWCAREEVESAYDTQKSFSQQLKHSRGIAWDDKSRDGTYYGLRALVGEPEPTGKASTAEPAAKIPPDLLDAMREALVRCQTRHGGDLTVSRQILQKYAPSGSLGDVKLKDCPALIADCNAAQPAPAATAAAEPATPEESTPEESTPEEPTPAGRPEPAPTTEAAPPKGQWYDDEPDECAAPSKTTAEPPAPQQHPKKPNGNGAHIEPSSEQRFDVDISCGSQADATALLKTIKTAGHSYGLLKLGCVVRGVTQEQLEGLVRAPGRTLRQQRPA
jgi:hypothetical protein